MVWSGDRNRVDVTKHKSVTQLFWYRFPVMDWLCETFYHNRFNSVQLLGGVNDTTYLTLVEATWMETFYNWWLGIQVKLEMIDNWMELGQYTLVCLVITFSLDLIGHFLNGTSLEPILRRCRYQPLKCEPLVKFIRFNFQHPGCCSNHSHHAIILHGPNFKRV